MGIKLATSAVEYENDCEFLTKKSSDSIDVLNGSLLIITPEILIFQHIA